MAITNGYATLPEFKAWNEIDAATNDAAAERAIEAASRDIDHYCDRHFWKTAADTPRVFDTCHPTRLDLGSFNDLETVASVATDSDGDGTYEVTWAASDYQLHPLQVAAPEPRPYTTIVALTRTFPSARPGTRAGRIRINGTWGWPGIPHKVNQACLIQAARIYKRRNSPEGVAGFGSEFGPIRLSTKMDPDVKKLLDPYRLRPLLVA